MTPVNTLTDFELGVLKLSQAGWEDIDIAEEVQLNEAEVADIIDALESRGYAT